MSLHSHSDKVEEKQIALVEQLKEYREKVDKAEFLKEGYSFSSGNSINQAKKNSVNTLTKCDGAFANLFELLKQNSLM